MWGRRRGACAGGCGAGDAGPARGLAVLGQPAPTSQWCSGLRDTSSVSDSQALVASAGTALGQAPRGPRAASALPAPPSFLEREKGGGYAASIDGAEPSGGRQPSPWLPSPSFRRPEGRVCCLPHRVDRCFIHLIGGREPTRPLFQATSAPQGGSLFVPHIFLGRRRGERRRGGVWPSAVLARARMPGPARALARTLTRERHPAPGSASCPSTAAHPRDAGRHIRMRAVAVVSFPADFRSAGSAHREGTA
jgi:hypothetical protein